MISPRLLQPGDQVVLVAPGKALPEGMATLEPALKYLKSWGLEPILGNHVVGKSVSFYDFAAPDAERLADLQMALDHPTAAAVICVRGGYGTTRLIDHLDFSGFQKHPKWVLGYSDVTGLHLHLQRLGYQSIHGPMPVEYRHDGYDAAIDSVRAALMDGKGTLHIPAHGMNWAPESTTSLSGTLLAGNLALITHTLGSPSEPSFQDAILMVEEVGEAPYSIDRMLLQLARSGRLSQLRALLVGGMDQDPDQIAQIVRSHTLPLSLPVFFGFPVSHSANNRALFCGRPVNLTFDRSTVTMDYL